MAKQTQAAFYTEFGGIDKIQIGLLDLPAVGEGEVLLRVKAAGINPVDYLIREGYLNGMMPAAFPVVPGWDAAGIVEEVGAGVSRLAVGDEVYGYLRRPTVQHGTFAEYLVVPEGYLAARPKNLKWEEAGGIPLAGLTAHQSLFAAGNLQAGQTVLVLGASGGVGSFAIQLAKHQGAKVIAVASAKNAAFMKELGADFTIDYAQGNVAAAVQALVPGGVDLIFDCIDGETLIQALSALKPAGKLVSILNNGQDLDPTISFQYVFVSPSVPGLNHLREMAEAGHLRVPIAATIPLADARKAFEQIETHHTTGKVVIMM